jgi:anti-sigma B factor antagonist
MKSRIRKVGKATIVALSGKITIGAGDEDLEETLMSLLDEGTDRIVLDLRRVGYVDSSGLGSMVACKRAAEERGVDVVLLGPSGKVHDLLHLTGLVEVFNIFSDEAEALARG